MENLTCDMCHQALQDRIKDVMVQWSSVKVSGYISRFAFVSLRVSDCRDLGRGFGPLGRMYT
jgi:hypothetical protein